MKTENNINSNSFSDDLHNSIKSEPVDLCGSEVILNKTKQPRLAYIPSG